MLPLIEAKKAELEALCRRHHVRRLDVFGSAARGVDFDPARSDIDFLVEFDRSDPEAMTMRTYLGLKDSLEALLGRPVDLVEPAAVRNPYIKASIERSRERVFGV
jgi:predicted nucleotidyltransferase